MLNSDMIETIDATPDTVVRLVNGHRYIIKEKFADVRNAIVEFRRQAGYSCIPVGISPNLEETKSQ